MIKEIITVSPRGFCAGVARSVNAVEEAIRIFGAPIYVKHEIVHNKTVVRDLEKKGVITVESVDEIPEGAVAVFSAHGSPPDHFEAAKKKNIKVIDATCPLVTKVHMEMDSYIKKGYHVVYIGHKGHVEGIGVIGEALKYNKKVPVVETIHDVEKLTYESSEKIAILTQTTLSVTETKKIIVALKEKFVDIIEPSAKDICYATTNRQKAIKVLARNVDVIFVVGSKTSSNSRRLIETARSEKCSAYLVDEMKEIKSDWIKGVERVGVTAGASAPEYRVQEIVSFFVNKKAIHKKLEIEKENMHFTQPISLMQTEKKANV